MGGSGFRAGPTLVSAGPRCCAPVVAYSSGTPVVLCSTPGVLCSAPGVASVVAYSYSYSTPGVLCFTPGVASVVAYSYSYLHSCFASMIINHSRQCYLNSKPYSFLVLRHGRFRSTADALVRFLFFLFSNSTSDALVLFLVVEILMEECTLFASLVFALLSLLRCGHDNET